MKERMLPVLSLTWRLLTFRAQREEMLAAGNRHLLFGLLCTWLVGVGRSWDNAQADIFQHLGVGSVIYIFVMAGLLWMTVRDITEPGVTYRQMLTFMALVSVPGIIYAVPVEKFLPVAAARNVNQLFLLGVAVWRVALLVYYFRVVLLLRDWSLAVVVLLPLSAIIGLMTVLRVLHEILATMGGLQDGQKMSSIAETIVTMLGALSLLAFLPLVIIYSLVRKENHERRMDGYLTKNGETTNPDL